MSSSCSAIPLVSMAAPAMYFQCLPSRPHMVIATLSAVVHQLLCLCGAGNYLEETPWPLEEVPLCRNHFNFCLKMKSMSAETCCSAVDPQGTPPHMVIATLSTLSSALGGSARGVDACTGCPNIGPLAGPIGNQITRLPGATNNLTFGSKSY